MVLFGAALNGILVAVGGIAGSFIKTGLSEKVSDQIMKGLSLVIIYIGISGTLSGENALVAIVSLAVGTVIGQLADLESRINKLGDILQRRFAAGGGVSIADGFVSCSLLICVGAMAVIGSLESGLHGDNTTLAAKSVIDGIAALIMATTLGIGVAFSGALVFLYEAAMSLGAQFIQPFLSDSIIAEMACVGGATIIAVGLNCLGVTKIKVMNMVPAIFMPIIVCRFVH